MRFPTLLLATVSLFSTVLASEPPTLQEIEGNRALWPKEITMQRDVTATVEQDGVAQGTMKLNAGSAQPVQRIEKGQVVLDFFGSVARVDPADTDLMALATELKANAPTPPAKPAAPAVATKPAPAAPAPAPAIKPSGPVPVGGARTGIASSLNGRLVSLNGKKLSGYSSTKLADVKYYALYFSAHWCPPCRKFTPELVDFYNRVKASHPEFEVIFVSSDRSADDMRSYMEGAAMPWPALEFGKLRSTPNIAQYAGRGIPNLVFIDADGNVLSASYEGDKYVGPRKVLRDIQAKLE